MKQYLVSLLAAVALAERETLLLVEACRHGARTSGQIYPLTVDSPYDNF
jgi:hypothetical protein